MVIVSFNFIMMYSVIFRDSFNALLSNHHLGVGMDAYLSYYFQDVIIPASYRC